MYTGLNKNEEKLPEILQADTPIVRHLHHATNTLVQQKINAELELRHGSVADEILIESRTGNYDLIILGASNASTKFSGWLMGDITNQIVHAASCPVFVYRKSNIQELRKA